MLYFFTRPDFFFLCYLVFVIISHSHSNCLQNDCLAFPSLLVMYLCNTFYAMYLDRKSIYCTFSMSNWSSKLFCSNNKGVPLAPSILALLMILINLPLEHHNAIWIYSYSYIITLVLLVCCFQFIALFIMFVFAASLANSSSPLQQREKLYLLAVGYYRTGEYSRSRQLLEQCLEVCLCFP